MAIRLKQTKTMNHSSVLNILLKIRLKRITILIYARFAYRYAASSRNHPSMY